MPELDREPTVDEIVANPSAHGFSWFTGTVEKDGKLFNGAQLVRHENVDLLTKTFGVQFHLDSANGTSHHVANQAVNRNLWWSALGETPSRKVTELELRRAVVARMLGQKAARRRTVVTETVYAALDGKTYPTLVEAQAASMAFMVDQQQAAE